MIETLLIDATWSSLRWLIGTTIGTAAAILLFLLSTMIRPAHRPVSIGADFLRAIPVIALVPAFFALFGTDEIGKFLMIGWATAFPIYVHITHVAVVPPQERLVFLAGRASRGEMLRWIRLPLLGAAILGGLRIALGIGWISVVAAEMLGVFDTGPWSGGLGQRVVRLAEIPDYPLMAVCLALFGFLGLGSAFLFEWLSNWMVRATRLDIR